MQVGFDGHDQENVPHWTTVEVIWEYDALMSTGTINSHVIGVKRIIVMGPSGGWGDDSVPRTLFALKAVRG